jgi:putative nucleotidyltransferase with HDIG domain
MQMPSLPLENPCDSIQQALELSKSGKEPVILTRNGQPEAVLLTFTTYQNLAHSIRECEEKQNNQALDQAIPPVEQINAALENNRKKFTCIEEAYIKILLTLASNFDIHESYVQGHTDRMAVLASNLANSLGCNAEEVETINLAAALHDIGEITIPTDIMQKKEKINDEEWVLIRHHPQVGSEMVGCVEKLKPVADIIAAHHERFDGSGYPLGLKGESIPLGARIIAVVDTYDAITNLRLHRDPGGHDFAVQELCAGRGTLYDPRIVDAFLDLF